MYFKYRSLRVHSFTKEQFKRGYGSSGAKEIIICYMVVSSGHEQSPTNIQLTLCCRHTISLFRLLKTCFVMSSVALIKNISRMARKGHIRHLFKMTGNVILPHTTHFRLYYVWEVILPPRIYIQNTRRFCETRRSQAIH